MHLKLMDKNKTLSICPDQSPEEREAKHALIAKLKTAATYKPDYKHFIKNGKVHNENECSVHYVIFSVSIDLTDDNDICLSAYVS